MKPSQAPGYSGQGPVNKELARQLGDHALGHDFPISAGGDFQDEPAAIEEPEGRPTLRDGEGQLMLGRHGSLTLLQRGESAWRTT